MPAQDPFWRRFMNSKTLKVLITRPELQSEKSLAALGACGYDAAALPLFTIRCLLQPVPAGDYDTAIFVSANAVRCAIPLLQGSAIDLKELRCIAIGSATATALRQAGYKAEFPSAGSRSEDLLQQSDILGDARQVLLVAGEGGRGLIEEELASRNIAVARLEVYARVPNAELAQAIDGMALHWGRPDVISLLSGSAVDLMMQALTESNCADWCDIPVVAPSHRVAEIAMQVGFSQVLVQPDPSVQGLIHLLDRLQLQ